MPTERATLLEFLSRIHLFRGIQEPKLQQAIDLMEEIQVPAGNVIFQQNDDPDFFYFILEGKARVTRYNRKERKYLQLGFLAKYDYFGQEVLETNWPRQVTIETVEGATLLRLSVQNFIQLIDLIPELSQRLQMVLDSYKLMLKSRFIWQDPEEMIYFISRRHVLFMVKKILPPVIFGGVFIPLAVFFWLSSPAQLLSSSLLVLSILLSLGWLIWAYMDWSNDYFIVTNRRVVYLEKVILLYDTRQESPLSAIQSTSFTTSQTGRILKFGDVSVRTLIGTIPFTGVPYPELLMALIQEQQTRTQIQEIFTRQDEIQQRIDLRIKSGPQLPPIPKQAQVQEPPNPMKQFLATMFHTRFEEHGIVTFRTHWSILITRVWLPSLLLIGLAILVISSAVHQFNVIPATATLALALLVGSVLLIWWIYQYFDWHNDIYQITQDQVVDIYKKPLGQENRQSAPLGNILSIEYKRRGFFGLVLDFGTVYIHVGDQTLTFDDVSKPSEVQRELFDKLAQKKNKDQQKVNDDNARRMADWINGYNEWNAREHPPTQPPPPVHPGF